MQSDGTTQPDDQLEEALKRAVLAPVDALLLSGGIDSSLLAAMRAGITPSLPAITVALAGYDSREKPSGIGCIHCALWPRYPEGCGSDPAHARQVVEHLGLEWHPMVITQEEALDTLRELIRLTKSYALDLLNDIAIYTGLKYAHSKGWHTVWTGDDADTLFAGYGFESSEADWESYKVSRFPHLAPPATRLGELAEVQVAYPYLHEEVVGIAYGLSLSDVTEWREGDKAGNIYYEIGPEEGRVWAKQWGKLPLRRIGERVLPNTIADRTKTHIMFGSALCRLEYHLAASLTNEGRVKAEAARALDGKSKRYFKDDAHRAMFAMYADMGIEASPPSEAESVCTWCGSGGIVGEVDGYCPTCGAWPALRAPDKVIGTTQPSG